MLIERIPEAIDHRLNVDNRYAIVAAHDTERLPKDCVTHSTGMGALQDSENILPRVLDLASLSGETIASLKDLQRSASNNGETPPLSVLLKCDASVRAVCAHLARAQLAQHTDGKKAWLRVQDPRVWIQLARILTDSQSKCIFGPIESWTFYLQGNWYRHRRPKSPASTSLWKDTTWSAVERIGVVNRVLAHLALKDQSLDVLEKTSEKIDKLTARAALDHGLHRIDDLVDFGVIGMTIHPSFDQHPTVVTLLNDRSSVHVGNPDQIEQTALDRLHSQGKTFWQKIKTDLNSQVIEGKA